MDDIVIVGQSEFWSSHLLRKPDVRVHVVDTATTLLPAFASAASLVTVSDLDSIDQLTWAAGRMHAAGVVPVAVNVSGEMAQLSRAYLAAALGLADPAPGLVARTRDKRLMKTWASRAGVPMTDYIDVPDPADAPDLTRLGFPLVVKPASGAGSQLTYVCRDETELAVALARQRTPALAERYVAGVEHHVDAVWRDGEPWVFMVSEYGCPPIELSQGMGSVVSMVHDPAQRPGLYADALRLSRLVNEALGVTDGPTHLEFFETDDGLLFSEMATRMAGGVFPSLSRIWCGVDLRELCTHEARGGGLESLTFHAPAHPVTGMINIAPPRRAGVVEALPDVSAIAAEPHVLHVEAVTRVGGRVDPAADDGHHWGVVVVVGTDTTDDVHAIAADLTQRYPLTVH